MRPASALLLIALPLALAGCGNKGPLVLPTPEPPTIEIEPEGGVPVETDVPDTLPAQIPGGFDPLNPPIDPATVPVDVNADAGGGDGDG